MNSSNIPDITEQKDSKRRKLAVVISHPTQHFAPVYVELAKHSSIELRVFYIAENGVMKTRDEQFDLDLKWDVDLLNGYSYEFLKPGKVLESFGFFEVDSKRLTSALLEFGADWLWVHGYGQLANWRAIFGVDNRTSIIYSSDSNVLLPRSRWRRAFKSIVVKLFFKRVNRFLCVSPSNRRYLEQYGVSELAIVQTAFPVDIERLERNRLELPVESRIVMRQALGIDLSAKVLLVVGKLIKLKRCQDAIESLARLDLKNTHLVFVGSGECKQQLQNLTEKLKLEKRVHFVGFINQASLAKYFDMADVLVFPSEREAYGAIAAEVLPFGLPIVLGDKIGALGACAVEGENALVYETANVTALAENLNRLLSDNEMYRHLSDSSLRLARKNDKRVIAADIANVCVVDTALQ